MKKMLRYLFTMLLMVFLGLTASGASTKVSTTRFTNPTFEPVTLNSITALSANPNNAGTGIMLYKVEFSKAVTGITAANFALAKTGGISTAIISNVIQNPIVKTTWQVTVKLGPVTNDGTVQLSMVSATGLSLSLTNHLPFLGETYTVLPDIVANTLPLTNISSYGNSAELLGEVKSLVANVSVGFDYGNSPTLANALHINATTNGTVTAGSGLQTAKAVATGLKPGAYFYRVTTNAAVNGEVKSFNVSYVLRNIKLLSLNPNNAKTGSLLFEVEFNGLVEGLSASNFQTIADGNIGNNAITSVTKSSDPLKPNSWLVNVALYGTWGNGVLSLALVNTNGLNVNLTNFLPWSSLEYTIIPEMNIETLNPMLSSKQSVLQGSIRSDVEDVTVSFDYGDSPSLADAVHVAATTNTTVTASSGAKIAQYVNNQDRPGTHYYRVVARSESSSVVTYGKTVTYTVPKQLKEIKAIGLNPNNAKLGRLAFEVVFNTFVDNLSAANFTILTTGNAGNATILTVVKSNDPSKPYSWFVFVNVLDQWGDGTLALQLANTNGVSPSIANELPFTGEAYQILPEMNVETLNVTNVTLNGYTLQGAVRSDVENVAVVFDYGDSPTLADAIHVSATTNATVTAGSGSQIAQYELLKNKAGNHYYRVTAVSADLHITYGKILNYSIPTLVKSIKAVSANPTKGDTPLVYEVEFNDVINNLTAANFSLVTTGNAGSASILTVAKSNDPLKPYTWVVQVSLTGEWGNGTLTLALSNNTGLSPAIAGTFPFTGQTYNIAKTIQVETLGTTSPSLNGHTLQGSVSYAIEDVTAGFDYGDSPTLTDAIHVTATINGFVTAGSGTKIAQYALFQNKPGTHYYRVTAQGTGSMVYGKILNYGIPYAFTGIKAVAANPNNGSAPLVFEVQFNGLVNNLSLANLGLVTTGNLGVVSISTIVKSTDPLKPNSWLVTVTLGQLSKGTVALVMNNANGLSPAINTYLPFVGEAYTISPQPSIQMTVAAALSSTRVDPLVSKEAQRYLDGLNKDAKHILTPNADGVNDYLEFKDLDEYLPTAIVITNRSGKIIYRNNHYQNDWDGTYNGKPLATDTYYYSLDFGEPYSKVKGYVTLVNGK
jgi:gliding motility-associated-like protein